MNHRPHLLGPMNQLLIDLGRSLLQYVGEAWPWTPEDEARARETIESLVARQSDAVGRLTEFLDRRNWPIDFGLYPVEYTDLHYVSLDFLMKQLIQNADELVTEIDAVFRRCPPDSDEAYLLDGVLRDQQYIANKLRELAEAHNRQEPAGAPPE